MILLAAATFFQTKTPITELQQADQLLAPLLGHSASVVFAIALLFAGIASSITSGMAGGSIMSGIFSEPYDIKDNHSRLGVLISLVGALIILFFIKNAFMGLIISQMILSIQLPITVFTQVYLTSSKKVMGKYANTWRTKISLVIISLILLILNIMLFHSFFV